MASARIVVFDAPLTLLLLGERNVEVEVEVVPRRGRPRKCPPHPPLVSLYFCEWRPRHCRERNVMVRQMDAETVVPVRDRRTSRAPGRVVGSEHVTIDQELGATPEQVCQRGVPFIGVKPVLLIYPDPGQLLTPPRQLIAPTR